MSDRRDVEARAPNIATVQDRCLGSSRRHLGKFISEAASVPLLCRRMCRRICRRVRRRIPRVAGACPEVELGIRIFAVFQQERSAHASLSLLCDALDLT